MTNSRRGFSRERHPFLKLGICVLAVAGFTGGWTAFSASHGEPKAVAQAAVGEPSPLPAATGTPTRPSGSTTPTSGTPVPVLPTQTPAAAPTAEGTPAASKPTPAVTPKKKSRGS